GTARGRRRTGGGATDGGAAIGEGGPSTVPRAGASGRGGGVGPPTAGGLGGLGGSVAPTEGGDGRDDVRAAAGGRGGTGGGAARRPGTGGGTLFCDAAPSSAEASSTFALRDGATSTCPGTATSRRALRAGPRRRPSAILRRRSLETSGTGRSSHGVRI